MEAYLDNAATTRAADEVAKVVTDIMLNDYGNPSSKHSKGFDAEKQVKHAAQIIAKTLKCDEKEILFTSGGTESNNMAIIESAIANKRRGNHVIVSSVEHSSVKEPFRYLEENGFNVTYLPVDNRGLVSVDALKEALDEETILVSVMLVNNEIGTIEPIKELAEIAHIHGAFFHTDAVQAVGHIPVNVTVLGIDMLSASAHKFNGPKGVGFLYIRKGTDIHSLVDGGAQEFGMRAGTENIAAIVAMAEALRKNCAHMDETESRLCKMENSFIHALNKAGIDFIRNGADNHLPGNISISIKNASGEMLLHRLDLKGICISTGSACDSVNTQVSHVIQAISVPEDYAAGTIRISFGRNNHESDAQDIADAIVSILKN